MSTKLTEAEKVATIARFGMDKPKPYIVHVYGPDDIHEFDTWLDAIACATAFNAEAVAYVARRIAEEYGAEPPYLTRAWATPYTRQHAVEAGVI